MLHRLYQSYRDMTTILVVNVTFTQTFLNIRLTVCVLRIHSHWNNVAKVSFIHKQNRIIGYFQLMDCLQWAQHVEYSWLLSNRLHCTMPTCLGKKKQNIVQQSNILLRRWQFSGAYHCCSSSSLLVAFEAVTVTV